jgi:uncharacterized protein (DUF362 family)
MAVILRWICEKCDKRWIYPVEKCVYCKGSITKQKGTELKVTGMTKVNIPSPMHPIVPYNIVLLEDEHGNRIPRKTMKDYKVGDRFSDATAKTADAVSAVRVKYDVYEAVEEAMALCNFKIEAKEKVLIKPSCITAAYPYQAVNTSPEFVDAIVKVLFDFGIKKDNIIVAEQALLGSDGKDAASKAGIIEACKKHGIEFVDIAKASKSDFEEIEKDGFTFKVYKEAIKRMVINTPIMKTNFQLGVSGATENLLRLCDGDTQRRVYEAGINETLPKLAKAVESFNVGDATNGLMGQGPLATGEPAFMNLVLASKSPENLDAIFSEIGMLGRLHYVTSDPKKIEVVGNSVDSLKYEIKPAHPNESPHPDIKIIDGGACPSCLNLMNELTSKLIGARGDEITVAMGSHLDAEALKHADRLVILGNCVIKSLGNKIESSAKIPEEMDFAEQMLLMKKLLTTKGVPKITSVDKLKSKMKNMFSKVGR